MIPFVPRRLLCVVVLALAIAGSALGASVAAAAPADGVVVRFAPGSTAAQRARAAHAAGATVPRHIVGATWLVRARAGARAAIHRLERRRAVVSATPEYRARVAAFAPNDTGVAQPTGPAGGWAAQQWDLVGPFGINAPGAWDAALRAGVPGGRGVRVAVVDTGVAYADRGRLRRSPDLAPSRLLRGHDFVDNDPYPNDENGHGTFVACDDRRGGEQRLSAWSASPTAPTSSPSASWTPTAGPRRRDIAAGIRYAVDRGAQVINLVDRVPDPLTIAGRASITSSPDIREAIRYAHSQGVVVVAAAGNLGQGDVAVAHARPRRHLRRRRRPSTAACGDYSNYGRGPRPRRPGRRRGRRPPRRRELPRRPAAGPQHLAGHVPPLGRRRASSCRPTTTAPRWPPRT